MLITIITYRMFLCVSPDCVIFFIYMENFFAPQKEILKKIDILFKDLQYKIPGISSALALKERIQKIEHTCATDPASENFYILNSGAKLKLTQEGWVELSTLISRSIIKNQSINFKQSLLERSFSEELLRCINIVLNSNSTEISRLLFCLPEQPYPINLMTMKIISLVIQESEKKNYTHSIASVHENNPMTESSFIYALGESLCTSFLPLFSTKQINKHVKSYFFDQVDMTGLFTGESFKKLLKAFQKRFSSYFSSKFLKIFLLVTLLKVIQSVQNDLKIYPELPEFHGLLQLDSNIILQKEQLHSYMVSINTLIKGFYLCFGKEFMLTFVEEHLVSRIKRPRKANLINFNFIDFDILYSRELPRITPYSTTNRIQIRKYSDHLLYFDKARRQIRSTNDGSGFLSKPSVIDSVMDNTKFCINLEFLAEFLTLFKKTFSMPLADLCESEVDLRFISEIFGFNLIRWKSKMSDILFKNLVLNILDLRYMTPLTTFGTKHKRLHHVLQNKLKSFKLFFCELLFQLCVMSNFNFFTFGWFCCYRLRVYYTGSALNLNLPFARGFLQFYSHVAQSNEARLKTRALLLNQLNSVTLSIKPQLLPQSELSLINILKTNAFKPTECFTYRHLLYDYYFCVDENYKYQSQYSLDAVGSGTQMLGLSLRDKRIAKLGMLLKNTTLTVDIYTMFLNHVRTLCHDFTSSLNLLFDAYPHLSEILQKFNVKILDLKIKYYAELYTEKRWPLITNAKLKSLLFEDYFNLAQLTATSIFDILLAQESDFISFEKLFLPAAFSKFFIRIKDKDEVTCLKLFIILAEMLNFTTLFHSPLIVNIFERKLVKHMLMTLLYGSSSYGRLKMMLNSLVDFIFRDGLFHSDADFIQTSEFCNILNLILSLWVEEEHSYLTQFHQLVAQSCYNGTFTSFHVCSPFAHMFYKPKVSFSKPIKIMNKSFRYNHFTKKTSFKGVSKGFVANYVHFCDATIVQLFLRKLSFSKFFGYTVHDRFFIHPAFGYVLHDFCKDCYLQFYNLDLFSKNFSNTPLFKARVLLDDPNYLSASDLLNPSFVKH